MPLLLLLLILAVPVQAQIYQWTDEQGRPAFGDTPPDGVDARPVRVDRPATLPGLPDARQILQPPPPSATEESEDAYQRLTINQPEQDGVVRTNLGQVDIAVNLSPTLKTDLGHRIRIRLNGDAAVTTQATQTTLEDVPPGTHTLQAEVLDEGGSALIRSDTITFHLLRTTVQQQSRPRP
ncbi:DUF4124 domain-containing protein [Ectothiorhodospira lacustris]|uniref:DUF4124 domain-containing protein n=1 Tax=Ectothiorhodospira lacustris TaxID=2899127 RepID=UPI001EE7B7E9|nr:DUF4124 domain-containing protein [Ectothiorhodospira lacustris]MCG5509086.1 DUF4124 domain-containing protein [Ectothiorhodospira lacustris]MCG5520877.1 DUF4124 domain-containing protein [Ectothiorhodospira lacustris]